ncbi:MAG: xanthine dehydrogenase family protein molybdopterin-binding subunit [Pseudomonadota bacterium]
MLFNNLPSLDTIDTTTTRRGFLVGATAASGGLLIGLTAQSQEADAQGAADKTKKATPNPMTGYLLISPDNKVTVLSSQFDMGQGAYHGIATLVIEELGASWDQVDVVGASGNTGLYGNIMWGGKVQGTGGSTSMATSFDRYRIAGATAREMLIAAASKSWSVPAGEVSVKEGVVEHKSGRRAGFGELVALAATLPVPQGAKLKSPEEWVHVGDQNRRRTDSRPKTNGTHPFTIDVKLPGMLTAVVAHPPKFGATVKSFDATRAKKVRGVTDVVQIDRGVAVVAEHMWAAIKGREALTVTWDESKAETRSSQQILADYRKKLDERPGASARKDGNVSAALTNSSKVIEAIYEFPYLAHAAMEPLNAVAAKNPNGTIEIWSGHQLPDLFRFIASKVAGVKPPDIKLHVMKTGGGFGRRGVPDADVVAEAVMVAKAINYRAPVKVQWTREDDMTGGRYRPAYVHKLRAGLDSNGDITAWEQHIVGQSIVAGTPFEKALVKNGVDKTSVEGASNLPYAVPNVSVDLTSTQVGVPVLWWRAVGSTHTAYAVEAFIDELAQAASKDPYELRLQLLKDHPRHVGVLKLVAEKAGWGKPIATGRYRGIALHESFNSVVAHVVEISMQEGEPRVHRVVAAIDCGVAINPDVVRAQIEGGTGFGLGAILSEELTLGAGGRVEQTNYDSYNPLRMDQMPPVEVHIVPSTASPTGVGEPGLPSIGPALANAVAAASGKRVRTLPFAKGLVEGA